MNGFIFLFLTIDFLIRKTKKSTMKTVLAKIHNIVTIFLIITLIFSGCKGKTPGTQQADESISIEQTESKDEVLKEISDYPLPTSFEVTRLLIEAGASYILDLSNQTNNVSKYISLRSKALNLGIYGADLSYAATYNQTQETMQFLEASSTLIDELQISTAFNQTLVDRVEANLENVDSLIIIISDSFYDSYKYLQDNNQDKISLLILAGSWIEALYITTQITLVTTASNEKIVEIISDQESTLSKLLELMEPVKDDQIIKDIYISLAAIITLYDDASDPFTQSDLDKVLKATEVLRNNII
jgi:hypothetical protein